MAENSKECIYIYFIPSDGGPWANFLHNKLSEKEYMISSNLVNIHTLSDDHLIHDVNIVLVSPDFFNLTSLQPLSVLHQYKSLAVLLGTKQSEYDQFLAKNKGSVLRDWDVFCTEATETSVRQLLLRIIMLYEDTHKHDIKFYDHDDDDDSIYDILPDARPVLPNQRTSYQRHSSDSMEEYQVPRSGHLVVSQVSELEDYDVPPSQIRPSSTTSEQDNYDVPNPSDKKSSWIQDDDLADYDTASNIVLENRLYRVCPQISDKREVFLMLDRKAKGDVIITSEKGQEITKAEFLNKAIYHVTLPEQKMKLNITADKKSLGKSEVDFGSKSFVLTQTDTSSKLRMLQTLLFDETEPINMLCKSFKIEENTTEALDRHLAEKCHVSKSMDTLNQLLRNPDARSKSKDVSEEQWPTLLHFCAEYNLLKFSEALLSFPGMVELCNIWNCEKEDPFHIAYRKRHVELAKLFEKHMTKKDSVSNKKDSGIDCDERVSRDSDYMVMSGDKESSANKTPSDIDDIPPPERCQSDYMPMDFVLTDDEEPPPIPPKAHQVRVKRYVNDPDFDFELESNTDEQTLDPFKPYNLAELHMKHSLSESDAELGYNVSDIDIDDKTSSDAQEKDNQQFSNPSTFPGHNHPINESQGGRQHRSKSLSSESNIQFHQTKVPFSKRVGEFFKNIGHGIGHEHGHGHGHGHGHRSRNQSFHSDHTTIIQEENTREGKSRHYGQDQRLSGASSDSSSSSKERKEKADKPYRKNSKKYLWRKKSMRIQRALKDENINVINLPGKW